MRADDVPQDPSFLRNYRRVCYAIDGDRYIPAKSSGWDVERTATEQALLAQEEEVEAVRLDVVAGALSPLAYHLASHQMPPKLFAQHVGIATWRVRRHLRPGPFQKLAPNLKQRYAACLDMTPEALDAVPTTPTRVFFEDTDG